MMKMLWKIFFGRPDRPYDELPGLVKLLLEVRYIGYLFFLTFFVVQPFVIAGYDTPTGSMEPTIMTNSRYFALPSAYGGFVRFTKIKLPGYKKIRRGDVVIFKYPLNEQDNYVKRVIGLPGDQVEVRDCTVFVNGKALKEPYAHYEENPSEKSMEYGPVAVPQGHLFVLGDNRDASFDSRFWGFLPVKNVYGTPLFTYWSFDLQKHRVRFAELFKVIK